MVTVWHQRMLEHEFYMQKLIPKWNTMIGFFASLELYFIMKWF